MLAWPPESCQGNFEPCRRASTWARSASARASYSLRWLRRRPPMGLHDLEVAGAGFFKGWCARAASPGSLEGHSGEPMTGAVTCFAIDDEWCSSPETAGVWRLHHRGFATCPRSRRGRVNSPIADLDGHSSTRRPARPRGPGHRYVVDVMDIDEGGQGGAPAGGRPRAEIPGGKGEAGSAALAASRQGPGFQSNGALFQRRQEFIRWKIVIRLRAFR